MSLIEKPRVKYPIAWLLSGMLLLVSFNADSQEHSSSCPKSCKGCDQAVQKALKFIVSQQKENGAWEEKWQKKDSVPPPKSIGEWSVFTSLYGLALVASGSTTKDGPYKNEIQKAKEAAIEYVNQHLGKDRGDALPYVMMFLAHVYHADKSDDLKNILEKIRDQWLQLQLSDGGWAYGFGENPKKATGKLFEVTSSVIALLTLREAGIKVEEKVFEEAQKYYEGKTRQSDGSYTYHSFFLGKKPQGIDAPPISVGRSVAALWPLYIFGLSDAFKKTKEFSEKNIKNVEYGQHGPVYHLFWAGLSCYYTESTLWKSYWDVFGERIVKAQSEDGSILIKSHKKREAWPIDGIYLGPLWTTSWYTIVLQIHKGHLLFDKIKPRESK